MAEPDRARVAEVIVRADDEAPAWRGSGYRVASGAVLTAAHVVAGAGLVQVRFNADLPEEWTVPARVAVLDLAADVAVLRIAPRSRGEGEVAPALYGKVGPGTADPLDCTAVGFPRFKLRDDSLPSSQGLLSRYRDSRQANGTIAPLSNWRERTLEILVPAPAPDPDPGHSPWEGMSGAAVWCKGRIVGVVSKHHPGDGLGSLTAGRIERLYSTLDGKALALAGELARLPAQREQLIDVSDPAYAGEMECPYRGLEAFRPEDTQFFFGRRDVVTSLLGSLAQRPFLALVGASGSGKSSVLSAGLIPAASAGRDAGPSYHCQRITPTEDPVRQLAIAVSRWSTAELQRLPEDPAAWVAGVAASRSAHDPPLLLVVDQMEELHTLCADEQARQAFIRGLLALIEGEGTRNRVVVGVRTDFYAECADDPDLGRAMDGRQVNLRPMGTAELRSIIEGPAALAGLHVDPRLTEMLLADVGDEPGKLPLLSHALRATFERRQGAQLTIEHYVAVGRVQGALNKTADEVYESLSSQQRDVARAVFIRCTAGDGVIPDTRRPVRHADLDPEAFPGVDNVLSRLAAERLITLAGDYEGETGQQVVEVAHEALIRSWGRLKGWLDDYRLYRPVHQDLITAAMKWDLSGRSPGWLYQGASLKAARALMARDSAVRLTRTERDFLNASQRRRTARRRRLSAVAAAATATVITAAAVIVDLRAQAGAQAVIVTARQVASVAEASLGTDLGTAQLLAVAAYQLSDNAQTEAALFQTAAASPHLVRYYQTGSPVTSLGTSGNGQVVVAGTANGDLTWIDPVTGERHSARTGLGAISKVAVDAEGDAVLASNMRSVTMWRPRTGQVKVISLTGNGITSIAISPSGGFSAIDQPDSSSPDPEGRLLVLNVQGGKLAEARYAGFYDQVTFTSPNSVAVSVCGESKSFRLPDVTEIASGGKLLCPATNYVLGSSPSGRFAAYATYGSVTAWESGDISHIFSANDISPAEGASSVTVSDDGKRAAIVEGGSLYVAPLGQYSMQGSTNQGVTKLSANSDTTAAAFMGSSSRLVSAAGPQIALWDLSQLSRLGGDTGVPAPWTNMAGLPAELSISPDGHVLTLQGGATPYTGYRIGESLTRLAGWGNLTSGYVSGWRDDKPIFLNWTGETVSVSDSSGHVMRAVKADVGGRSYVMTARSARNGAEAVFVDQSANIWVLDMSDGKVSDVRAAPGSSAFSEQDVAVSADGRFAIICDQGHGRVVAVDLVTGSTRIVGSGRADGVLYNDGKMLILRDSGPLEIWDESGSRRLQSLPGDGGYASAMTASADGSVIARLSDNGTVSILSTVTGGTIGTFPLPSAGGGSYDPWLATSMQFTPDGRTLFAETSGGQLTRWTVSISALERLACTTVGRSMTPAEWRSLVGKNPPARLPCQDLRKAAIGR